MPPIGLVRVRPFIGGANYDSDINGANGPNTTPSFTLNPGGSKTDLGAGYYPMATVGNKVWFDDNANGIQEDDEAVAEGLKVEVYNMENELIDEAITDQNGIYAVEYLQKEAYYLKFEAPEGQTFTFANVSDDEDRDSDVTHSMGLNTTDPIEFKPGDEIIHIDAGIISSVLPLKWEYVDAIRKKNENIVEWATSLEVNVDRFEIQRSLNDARNFETIGSQNAVGNSNKVRNYSFSDKDVGTSGIYYYRIQQYDNDGKSSYSDIVLLSRLKNSDYRIYPNPTADKFVILGSLDAEKEYQIEVVNYLGEVLKKVNKYSIENEITYTLDGFNPGVYLIRISDRSGVIFSRNIIKL